MPLYNARGNINVTVNDTSMPFGIYAADGSLRVKVVSGTSPVGLYAADGAYNVVVVSDTDANTGIYHPSGALRGVSAQAQTGRVSPSGAIYFAGISPSVTNYSFLADSGSYSVVGSSALFRLNSVIVPDSGSYLVTGTDATLQAATISPPAVSEWTRVLEDGWPRLLESGELRYVEFNTADMLSGLTVTANADGTTAGASVNCNSTSGVIYAVVTLAANTAPTAAQIEAGTDGDGNPAIWADFLVLSPIDTYIEQINDLIENTDYLFSAVVRKSTIVGDYSNVVSNAFTSYDTAPVLSNVVAATTGSSGGASTGLFSIDTDNVDGTIKWAAYPTAVTPTKANILAGSGGALDFGSLAVTSASKYAVTDITGLAPSTGYRIHSYGIDAGAQESSSILSSSEFITYPNETLMFQQMHDGTPGSLSLNNLTGTNSQTDPLGGSNAVLVSASIATSTTCSISRNATYIDGNNRFRFYIKKVDWASPEAWIRFRVLNVASSGTAAFHFNLDTGATVGVPANITLFEYVPLPDDWAFVQFNCNLNFSAGADDVTGTAHLYLTSSNSGSALTTAGTYSILMYDYKGVY